MVFALVPDVVLYNSPITTSADGGSVVAISPEFSAPQVFLECWMQRKQTLGGDALEDPYDLTDAILGMKAHQQTYVILVITELFDFQVVPLFKAFHRLTHGGNNFRAQ